MIQRNQSNLSVLDSTLNSGIGRERCKSSADTPADSFKSAIKKRPSNLTDSCVGTGPDILTMLTEMKNDKLTNLSTTQNSRTSQRQPTFSNAYNTAIKGNIKEEDEDKESELSLLDSKKSAFTEKLSVSDHKIYRNQ